MAKLITAHQAFGPQLKLNSTVQLNEVADWIARGTNLKEGDVLHVLHELNKAILYFNRHGTPVKLPGIGIFTPSIDRDGVIKINLRADVSLRHEINSPRAYTGQINNKANIGIDNERYKAMWDLTHPDDPLEV
ncbi:MAG: hypothetical protein HC875_30715 [Anaerolineales bacterium]|nr:hypothetical protein [Anaerolineales bacterium]